MTPLFHHFVRFPPYFLFPPTITALLYFPQSYLWMPEFFLSNSSSNLPSFITARLVRSSSPVQIAIRQSFGLRNSALLAPEFSWTWLGPSRSWLTRCPRLLMFPCHWCSPGLLCNGSDTPEAAQQKMHAGPDAQSGPCTLIWWARQAGMWLDLQERHRRGITKRRQITGTKRTRGEQMGYTYTGCLLYMTGRNSSTGSIFLRGSAPRSFLAPCNDNM